MKRRSNHPAPPGPLRSFVLLCFFLSGMTGLIYEILWTRMIVEIIGGAPFAVSIILTVFMAGLGLGSFLAGRMIDRRNEPGRLIRMYGLLELAIGAYALAIPFLLTAFRPLYALLYQHLYGHFLFYNLLTFLGLAVLLCFPVICMGATLPILCRFYVYRLSHLGTRAGRLYGLNTIGAAVGSLLCGFWLINLLGMRGTLMLAVTINGAIGVSCLLAGYLAGRRSRDAGGSGEGVPTPDPDAPAEDVEPAGGLSENDVEPSGGVFENGVEPAGYPRALKGALVVFAVSGFCAMAYEVIWTKLLGLIVGPTTYSFTTVLVTFILGLALGSMLFGWLGDRTGKPLTLLLCTQVAAALFALMVSQWLGNSQLFFAKILFTLQGHFVLLSTAKALVLFAFMIPPTLCLGATFPLVGKIYTRSITRVGRSIGSAYAVNTLGAVSGSFCAGFLLIPLLGKETGLSLVAALQLLTTLAVAAAVLPQGRRNLVRTAILALPTLAGLWLCLHWPDWNRHLLAQGRYHRFKEIEESIRNTSWKDALLHGSRILAGIQQGELLFYGDGIGGFTSVVKHRKLLGPAHVTMINGGKPDASSHDDMKTQTLAAHFPMLFHPEPKTVMVLGLASGITSGEVLHYPVEQLDNIEISREVVEASGFFLPWNNGVLSHHDSRLILQDGRAHLLLTGHTYDVIISEPSNPWMAGLATLFTRDFFELAKGRLNPGGIFVQFLHAYQMDWPTFSMVGRTFAQVYPNSLLVVTSPYAMGTDFLLVGVNGDRPLSLEAARKNLAFARRSTNITLNDHRLFHRLIVTEDLPGLFGQGPVNTDAWPRLEFAAPKLMYTTDITTKEKLESEGWLSPGTERIVRQISSDPEAQIDFAAYALSVYSPCRDMVDVGMLGEEQKKRYYGLLERYCTRNIMDRTFYPDEALRKRCTALQIECVRDNMEGLDDPTAAYNFLADLYASMEMLDEAAGCYAESLRLDPDDAYVHQHYGIILGRLSRYDQAVDHLRSSLRLRPGRVQVYNLLADFLTQQNKLEDAVAELQKALVVFPEDPTLHNNLGVALARLGKIRQAMVHFYEALRIKPDYEGAKINLQQALRRQEAAPRSGAGN